MRTSTILILVVTAASISLAPAQTRPRSGSVFVTPESYYGPFPGQCTWFSYEGGVSGATLTKTNAKGQKLWEYGPVAGRFDVDSQGNVFAVQADKRALIKLNPKGEPLWFSALDKACLQRVMLHNDAIYVQSDPLVSFGQNHYLAKFDASGRRLWTRKLGLPGEVIYGPKIQGSSLLFLWHRFDSFSKLFVVNFEGKTVQSRIASRQETDNLLFGGGVQNKLDRDGNRYVYTWHDRLSPIIISLSGARSKATDTAVPKKRIRNLDTGLKGYPPH